MPKIRNRPRSHLRLLHSVYPQEWRLLRDRGFEVAKIGTIIPVDCFGLPQAAQIVEPPNSEFEPLTVELFRGENN